MRYTHLFFDLDGTLSDSSPGIVRCFLYALQQMGIAPPQGTTWQPSIIGPAISESFARFGVPSDGIDEAIAHYRAVYNTQGYMENEPYFGIESALRRLLAAGAQVSLATAKPTQTATAVLDYFGYTRYFAHISGSEPTHTRPGKIDVLQTLLSRLPDVPRTQVVMIGDRKHDLEAAAALGIDGIGVRYGFGSAEELQSCPHRILVDSPAQLADFLLHTP